MSVDIESAKQYVDAGWHPLVEDCYRVLTESGVAFAVDQVKEKHGALRVYWHFTGPYMPAEYDRVAFAILDLERKSAKTCERCGAPGTIQQRGGYGWLKATCGADHLLQESRDERQPT